MDSENYKFVQNLKCEFFPCHEKVPKEEFNCLFCFCPLYMLKNHCGGNFKRNNGIKDCTYCTVPHAKGSYERIMSKMKQVVKIGSQEVDTLDVEE